MKNTNIIDDNTGRMTHMHRVLGRDLYNKISYDIPGYPELNIKDPVVMLREKIYTDIIDIFHFI